MPLASLYALAATMSGVGYARHNVGVYLVELCKKLAAAVAGLVDAYIVYNGVASREVDILEYAVLGVDIVKENRFGCPIRVNLYYFAGLDVPYNPGVNGV